jgi:hypothetical protein
MRVFFTVAGGALLAGLLSAACSDAGASGAVGALRRSSPATEPSHTSAPPAASPGRPSSSDPPPAPSTPAVPTTTPDAGTASGQATPAGGCATPKCFGALGVCGCIATDSNGASVSLGCQDGQCSCLGGNDATFDGDCANAADAQDLFFANCGCL